MQAYLLKYTKYTVNILLWGLGVLLAIKFLPRAMALMLPFILGWLVALMANPLVKLLESKIKLKRKFSSMLIIVVVLSLLVLFVYMGIAQLIGQATAFGSQLPDIYPTVTVGFLKIKDFFLNLLDNMPPDFRTTILEISSDAVSVLSNFAEKSGKAVMEAATGFAKNIPSIFIAFAITIISSYFMLAQKEELSLLFKQKISRNSRRTLDMYSKGVNKIIGGYFKAQLKLLTLVAIILFIGFTILGTGYALLFSVLIALLDFLPFFGTGTALGPWALFALLSGDYRLAVGLVVIYLVTQGFRRIMEPKILGDTIGMNPLLTLVLMYAGYRLFGVWGLILSAPVGMLVINLYKKGAFDNQIFIVKDIWNDINQLKNIDAYKARGLEMKELREAELRTAELRAAELRAAELRAAQLKYEKLRDAELKDAEIKASKLKAAEVKDEEIRSIDLKDPEIKDAMRVSAELKDVEIVSGDQKGAEVKDSQVRPADLKVKNKNKM